MEKKKRLHWMPLDWPAYWADTRGFDAEKHGAYLMLLGELWMKKGRLRADDPELPGLAACTPERWAVIGPVVLAKFTVDDEGMLVQKRLGAEFEHAQKVSAARRAAGAEGAAKRWQNGGKPIANAMANAKQNDRQEQKHKHSPNGESFGASADAPAKDHGKVKKPPYSQEFEDAWAIYPKRAGGNSKADAYKAWCARLNAGATVTQLMQGTERYTLYCFNENKIGTEYVKQASTFYGTGFHFLEAWASPPKAAASSTRHDVRAAAMNGLGSKQGPQHETHRTDRTEPIDVQARVVPDAEQAPDADDR